MTQASAQKIQSDWISKTLAGFFLGLFIAFALIGLFAWLGPGGIDAKDKIQFNMWLIPPIWLSIFSLSYFFQTGLKAWQYLGAVAFVLSLLLLLTRWLVEGF